jgi:hypothetical protein
MRYAGVQTNAGGCANLSCRKGRAAAGEPRSGGAGVLHQAVIALEDALLQQLTGDLVREGLGDGEHGRMDGA